LPSAAMDSMRTFSKIRFFTTPYRISTQLSMTKTLEMVVEELSLGKGTRSFAFIIFTRLTNTLC
jgi:hypothetical protein